MAKDLFKSRAGDHLRITGPNGSGKTTILRILAGLLPVFRGLLTAPRPSSLKEIFYIPQRPPGVEDYMYSAREDGWDAVKEWKEEVQLARMFYHHSRFCVLDEATSAVSTDVEALLYMSAKDAGAEACRDGEVADSLEW